MDALSEKILKLQGDGDYEGVAKFMDELGAIGPGSCRPTSTACRSRAIPVDVVFEQGPSPCWGSSEGRRAWAVAPRVIRGPAARPRRVHRAPRAAGRRAADGRTVRLLRPHGPGGLPAGPGIDVRPHPHIALATVTYLFEGEILHRDSLGMPAGDPPGRRELDDRGRGIVHSERTTPRSLAQPTPRCTASSPGSRCRDGARGRRAGVPPPPGGDAAAAADAGGRAAVRDRRRGIRRDARRSRRCGRRSTSTPRCPRAAASSCRRTTRNARSTSPTARSRSTASRASRANARARARRDGAVRAIGRSRAMLLGGAPLPTPRHIWWNFVSSRERIEHAKLDWARIASQPSRATRAHPVAGALSPGGRCRGARCRGP